MLIFQILQVKVFTLRDGIHTAVYYNRVYYTQNMECFTENTDRMMLKSDCVIVLCPFAHTLALGPTLCTSSLSLSVCLSQVVCHQLGYANASRATVTAEFGQGTGEIWLDDLACTGFEDSLAECLNNGWGDHNCRHREDAGAVCQGESV